MKKTALSLLLACSTALLCQDASQAFQDQLQGLIDRSNHVPASLSGIYVEVPEIVKSEIQIINSLISEASISDRVKLCSIPAANLLFDSGFGIPAQLIFAARGIRSEDVTDLMMAAASADLETVKRLANETTASAKDSQGNTALMYAVYSNNADVVNELLDHSDIIMANNWGQSPIILAYLVRSNAAAEAIKAKSPSIVETIYEETANSFIRHIASGDCKAAKIERANLEILFNSGNSLTTGVFEIIIWKWAHEHGVDRSWEALFEKCQSNAQ
ncbi:hypothetical protein A3F66_05295 [candidate division TM6 bacterium RIFCSPHIGHO2_12_FULL_32_22]|nr:MAG: hypothetical protein A3F66_05295 [candidate division TM6 bacterium RIFCSPHIGHO2_12_FULL_32_22]